MQPSNVSLSTLFSFLRFLERVSNEIYYFSFYSDHSGSLMLDTLYGNFTVFDFDSLVQCFSLVHIEFDKQCAINFPSI